MSRRKSFDRLVTIQVVTQREDRDCAVACLAMLAGISYEDSLRVVCNVDDEGATDGLYLTQLMKAAEELGLPLRIRRKFDLKTATGILYYVDKKDDYNRHVNIVRHGVVVDTNGRIWMDAAKYCRYYNYAPKALLVEIG